VEAEEAFKVDPSPLVLRPCLEEKSFTEPNPLLMFVSFMPVLLHVVLNCLLSLKHDSREYAHLQQTFVLMLSQTRQGPVA